MITFSNYKIITFVIFNHLIHLSYMILQQTNQKIDENQRTIVHIIYYIYVLIKPLFQNLTSSLG